MRSTKTVEKDYHHYFDISESFSEQQSEYKLSQTSGKNIFTSNRARNQRRRRNKQLFNQSKWTLQQNILYKQFLLENKNLFEADQYRARKQVKINVLMSQYIKTRSSDQCRSHHQKMKKNYSDVLSIIRHIEKQHNGVIDNKRQIGEELIQQQEMISIDQPSNQREIVLNIQSIHENQKIWDIVEKNTWHDCLQL